ncbi:efflux RND transporter periplasmic adaptor subunit [Virgibacillus salexigens]|uniref:efflux RND transporter periplasmic adaptor subunit n=1 Tax=Virgibacillus TaxID=84406 RepID=UPI00136DCEF0|nr:MULTISPECIES: efflux RND transporter periplasmic adaptor subunit [Virgibacillus]MYL43713.1 HlyD family efflux transporter periplasmic adaptor subunit [Virgibacillus massiliensis]
MRKYKKRFLQAAVILFIGLNFILVYIDKEEKVDRIAYISEWSKAFQTDLEENLHTSGVLTAVDENYVYFDEQAGSFAEFLVEKGDQVTNGDPLFSYTVDNYYEAESQLLQAITQLEGEITAIQQAISQMNAVQIPQTNTEAPPSLEITEEEIQVEFPQDPIQAAIVKEQYLVEKEKELAQKNAALTSMEDQLTELQSTGDTITVESPYSGSVAAISPELKDPIMIIESQELQAEGELSEQDRAAIETGQPVEIEVVEKDIHLQGTIEQVSDKPKDTPTVNDASIYPFIVSLQDDGHDSGTAEATLPSDESADETVPTEGRDTQDNQTDLPEKEVDKENNVDQQLPEKTNLLPGYHTRLVITTKSSMQATALFEEMVHQNTVWKMTNEGKIMEQQIESGILMNKMLEITSGVQPNEWVAGNPESQLRNQAAFITPLKWGNGFRSTINPKEIKWYEPLLTGLVSR